MPIDDWVADTATNGRARRLGRRAAHVTFHQLRAMHGCSPAPMLSHTCIRCSSKVRYCSSLPESYVYTSWCCAVARRLDAVLYSRISLGSHKPHLRVRRLMMTCILLSLFRLVTFISDPDNVNYFFKFSFGAGGFCPTGVFTCC